jgi:hypothetical protein
VINIPFLCALRYYYYQTTFQRSYKPANRAITQPRRIAPPAGQVHKGQDAKPADAQALRDSTQEGSPKHAQEHKQPCELT